MMLHPVECGNDFYRVERRKKEEKEEKDRRNQYKILHIHDSLKFVYHVYRKLNVSPHVKKNKYSTRISATI